MTKILFIKKQDVEDTLTTNEIIRLFEESENLDKIKEAVEKAEDRLLVTWATVEMKDKAGEIIPIGDVVQQQDILLKRNGPITDTHTNKIVGQTLAYKVMEHPKTKSTGILHLDKIFDDNQLDEKVWKEIQTGEKTGSSVGGFNTGLSFTQDNVTGEKAKVLEGFNHIETSMVDDPCNPMALNEAFSIVAKSNVQKPAKLDRCVSDLMGDPDFKSQEGRTKEESAFAVCTAAINKGWYKETDINKNDLPKDINKEGDTMSDEIMKAVSDLTETVKSLSEEVKKLKKQDVPEKKPEDEKPKEENPEEKKKAVDEEEPAEEPEEEKKKVKKEDAKADIDGETPAPAPESPVVDDSNDKDVFKKEDVVKLSEQVSDIQKQVTQIVERSATPMPGTPQKVNKEAQKFANLPMELATGKKRMGMHEVNKVNDEHLDSLEVQ